MPSEDLESIVYSGHSNEGAWFQALELIGFRAVFSGQSQVLIGLTSRGGGQGSGVAIAAAGWVGSWGSLVEEKYSSGPSWDSGSSALPAPQPGSALTHGGSASTFPGSTPIPLLEVLRLPLRFPPPHPPPRSLCAGARASGLRRPSRFTPAAAPIASPLSQAGAEPLLRPLKKLYH